MAECNFGFLGASRLTIYGRCIQNEIIYVRLTQNERACLNFILLSYYFGWRAKSHTSRPRLFFRVHIAFLSIHQRDINLFAVAAKTYQELTLCVHDPFCCDVTRTFALFYVELKRRKFCVCSCNLSTGSQETILNFSPLFRTCTLI